jgi:hypothetical protein
MYPDTEVRRMHASAVRDYVSLYVVKDVCIHNPVDVNTWEHMTEESCYCMVVVL